MSTTRTPVQAARDFVARVILLAVVAAGVVILLGVVFTLTDANAHNWLVRKVLGWGRWLTVPFHDLFVRTDRKQNVLVNWLLAALIYLGAGALLARLVRGPDDST